MPVKTRPDDSIRALKVGLEGRRQEIGEAVLARVSAIDGAGRDVDPEYTHGLRQAIEAGIDHSIEAATEGDDQRSPIPTQLLAQARLAARHRVPLEIVLRRYLAGHALIGDFVAEEAARQAVSPDLLRQVLRDQASRTDRVVAAISATYVGEARAARPLSSGRRRAELVRRLLDGELLDPSGLSYDLDVWHIGVVARGPGGEDATAAIAGCFDARRLIARADDQTHWLWLGFRGRPEPEQIKAAVSLDLPADLHVGFGEPGEGRTGWRLTHEQARAALAVAIRRPEPALRYKDVALLAAATQDELLWASLHQLYLEPLERAEESGRSLEATLRAYFEADRSVTSTAAALGVSRNTVTSRIRAVEDRVGYLNPLRAAQLLVALELADLDESKANRSGVTPKGAVMTRTLPLSPGEDEVGD